METPKPPVKLGLFKFKAWLLGLVLSFAASYGVCFMMFFSALERHRFATVARRIPNLVWMIKSYETKHEKLPTSLDDLRGSDSHWAFVDNWDHPFIYETDGKTWRLSSYGADGKPGGDGLDTDIHFDQSATFPDGIYHERYKELQRTAPPTYYQVWTRSGRFVRICLGMAFFMSLFQLLALCDRKIPSMEEVVTKPSAELAVGSALGVALATAFIFLVLNLLAGLGDVF